MKNAGQIQEADEETKLNLEELMRKYDTESRFRILSGWQAKLVALIAVAMSCFHFYTSGFGLLLAQKQGAVHLAFTLALVFLLYPASSKQSKTSGIPFYDFILGAIGVASALYLVVFFKRTGHEGRLPTQMDLIMGFLLIATLLEATAANIQPGPSMPRGDRAAFTATSARSMPDMLAHRGFNVARIVNHMYLGTEGIFARRSKFRRRSCSCSYFSEPSLRRRGSENSSSTLSLALAGWSTGGPAKVAVVSSGLMGTVSGSSVANVCTTGMFTIPLMKSVGYEPYFAGAVEAVASTGGQIMPPVMGAAAFIMAQILGVPYIEVAIAAVVPALLYYFAVMVQVHFEACRLGLRGIPWKQLPRRWFRCSNPRDSFLSRLSR